MQNIEYKLNNLKNILRNMNSIIVAYSGGVDSTFLLKVAKDIRIKVLAVTANSPIYTKRELELAKLLTKKLNIPHLIIDSNELEIEKFRKNPNDRCYYCKKNLFLKLKSIAKKENISYVADGTNVDDTNDYRPGMQALEELDIISPLKEAKLTKKEIRTLAKKMNLPNWNKHQNACLASRIPYGDEITEEKLKMINEAENFLIDLGIEVVRVRHHNNIARIETSKEYMDFFNNKTFRSKVIKKLKALGWTYITVDLEEYRPAGSFNK